MLKKIKSWAKDHKDQLITIGVIGAAVVGTAVLLKSKEQEFIDVASIKPQVDYELKWLQSTNPDSSWTIDIPLQIGETIEGVKDSIVNDLTTGNYTEVDL